MLQALRKESVLLKANTRYTKDLLEKLIFTVSDNILALFGSRIFLCHAVVYVPKKDVLYITYSRDILSIMGDQTAKEEESSQSSSQGSSLEREDCSFSRGSSQNSSLV